jgi:inosine-uridine nucleoside N-ribohydrolase
VIAITVSASGESHCAPALANIPKLIALAPQKHTVPIGCGDDTPLDGYAVFPEAWRTDSDTLSGVPIAATPKNSALKTHAVEIIHTAVTQAQEPVIIVATGPLTNIAQWLERYPQDKAKLERLIIMGGAVDVPGNIIVPLFTAGHPNTRAEWNFFVDPVAADRVLAAGLPIELVGLDVTNSVRVTEAIAQDFKAAAKSPAAKFWAQVLDKNDWFIASNEYYFWDSLAAVIALNPELCGGDQQHLGVEYSSTKTPWLKTSDMTMSDKRWDGKPRQHLDAKTAGALVKNSAYPAIKVCRTTAPSKIFSEFKQAMN